MYGQWAADNFDCAYIHLEVRKNGRGDYGVYENCGKGGHSKGAIRFTNAALYVGITKLKFINKPEYALPNDSIELNYAGYKKVPFFAKMTIKETTLRGGQTYTLYKIENY
jgi:hypothetical protein